MADDVISQALKMMPYGFYGVTSRYEDDVNAMCANWIIQSSFSPRQITIAMQKTCYTHELIDQGRVFAINIFDKDHADAIKPFTKGRDKNPDKMKNATYTLTPETECPILEGSAAYIECRLVDIVDTGGDHDLVVGEIIGAGVLHEGNAADTLTLPHIGWSYAG